MWGATWLLFEMLDLFAIFQSAHPYVGCDKKKGR